MKTTRILLLINLGLIALFGIASGIYKMTGGEADVVLYGKAGIGLTAMRAIGLLQSLAGASLLSAKTRRLGAYTLAALNLLASGVLFIAGVQPFGVISLLFVAMALLTLKLAP